MSSFTKGVISGQELKDLFDYANDKNFAIPAVNVVGTNSANAVLETAREVNSPVIIQYSNGGSTFNAGKGLSNEDQKAAIVGAKTGAMHVHELAKHYGVTTVLHTDHCAKKLLPWIKGLIAEGRKYHAVTGKPLYSSHMLDLSEEPIEENIEISCEYFKEMNELGMMIEIELGVTGGEEDGVDNTDIDSSPAEIKEAIEYGAIKMNIDTDMQWAFWTGVRDYYTKNHDYLQTQLGNPDGEDSPNKKFYDPRKWLRHAEGAFKTRLTKAFEDLNCIDRMA